MAIGLLACENLPSDSRSATPFIAEGQPTSLKGLDLGTENKPKRDLVTPFGIKRVYDPHQDPAVRIAFKKHFEEKQMSEYFGKWPRRLIDRSQKTDETARPFLPRILSTARNAQIFDYRRSECSDVQQLRCMFGPGFPRRMCPSDTLWGTNELTDCERALYSDEYIDSFYFSFPTHSPKYKLCAFDRELPLIATSPVSPIGKKSKSSEWKLPFHEKHIGDPKRGTMQQQFDQYFAIHCNKFFDVQSTQEPRP